MPVCRVCRTEYRASLHVRAKLDPGNSKTCRKCAETLPIVEFGRDKRSPDGHTPRCKRCRATGRKAECTQLNRDRMLRWKFGITADEYDAMLRAQGGGCAVCGDTRVPSHQKFLSVDHDHETGAIRGILCSGCNTALGLLGENPTRMVRLARYVASHDPSLRVTKNSPSDSPGI